MVSAYQFFTILAGCASTLVFGSIVNYFNCAANPIMLGRILAAFCSFGYIGSAICWWLAGKKTDPKTTQGTLNLSHAH
jgi:hypothetical protein